MSWFREKQENICFWIENVIKMLVGIFVFEKIQYLCHFTSNDEDGKVLLHIRLCDLKQKKKTVQEFAMGCGLIDHFLSVAHINDCTIPINSSFDLSVKVCMAK